MNVRKCIPLVLFLLSLFASLSVLAQQPQQAGAARRPPQPIPLFFKEGWKDTRAVPMTQDVVTNPDLEMKLYGAKPDDVNVTNEGGVPHVWTGLCPGGCAITLRHKENFADLTGKSRIRWYAKTSGFHQIRPVIKLADGTWLAGDFADAYTYDFHEAEFYLGDVRWIRLDIEKVQTKGTLLDKVDLSKIDEIGFVDLTPGSGHGLGGFSDMGWFEVYGKPVKR